MPVLADMFATCRRERERERERESERERERERGGGGVTETFRRQLTQKQKSRN
jgi:hypothetical protein